MTRSGSGDTIAAVATAPGRGGVGIVRISGPASADIAQQVVGKKLTPRQAEFVDFRNAGDETLDRGLALYFEGPHSFTGEDILELQGHGGPGVLDLVLSRVLELGARRANPGEFSERAFVNGRIDLVQAEAILDLVNSATRQAALGAVRSLSGAFSEQVHALDRQVLALRVYCEAAIDFADEEIDFLAESDIGDRLEAIRDGLAALRSDAAQGALLNDGASVVFVGAPNVGKSSIFNRLSGDERAIVTAIPGTTRDTLTADFDLDGLPVRVIDTAGLRDTEDPVEAEGVDRTRRAMAQADIVVEVVEDLCADDAAPERTDSTLLVRNKTDLSGCEPGRVDAGIVRVCALTGDGFEDLVAELKRLAGFRSGEGAFTARQRHLDALDAAGKALDAAVSRLDEGEGELLAEELRTAHEHLGTIVGETSTDDLLGEIFASFCIGK
ncbi:MAG: tRNA uridine-5-carboxymethylaminomethyl(34) synthesis GTPase MnmE [Gammaproteobacteria bacterium]|nr:tRNA uridine-5-carboxymethylaminomethyl(34) synthesis GTPase MnmE [Gammaproteobacteria bacterium]